MHYIYTKESRKLFNGKLVTLKWISFNCGLKKIKLVHWSRENLKVMFQREATISHCSLRLPIISERVLVSETGALNFV
jgi:hypothetical protein